MKRYVFMLLLLMPLALAVGCKKDGDADAKVDANTVSFVVEGMT